MGSYEAGAASALTRLGSEPCGARYVYDNCGPASRALPMAPMALLWGLNPRGPDARCPGVLGPHRTAREPMPSEAGGRYETREFANKIDRRRPRHRTYGLLARHRRAAALLAVTPFVAARRGTVTGLELPIGCTPGDYGAESRRHMLHTSKERRAHAKRQGALE